MKKQKGGLLNFNKKGIKFTDSGKTFTCYNCKSDPKNSYTKNLKKLICPGICKDILVKGMSSSEYRILLSLKKANIRVPKGLKILEPYDTKIPKKTNQELKKEGIMTIKTKPPSQAGRKAVSRSVGKMYVTTRQRSLRVDALIRNGVVMENLEGRMFNFDKFAYSTSIKRFVDFIYNALGVRDVDFNFNNTINDLIKMNSVNIRFTDRQFMVNKKGITIIDPMEGPTPLSQLSTNILIKISEHENFSTLTKYWQRKILNSISKKKAYLKLVFLN